MKYVTDCNEADNIFTISVTGDFKRPNDSLLVREVLRDTALEHGHRLFLVDMTQAEIKGEWTETAPVITGYEDKDRALAAVRIACVYSTNLSDNKILESLASSKGFLMSVFDDLDEAVAWLKI